MSPRLSFGCIAAACAVAGCSMPANQTQTTLEPAVAPVSATRHGAGHVDAHYALGRYYQGQIRYDQAIDSYLNVLDAQPDHVEARNALGVVYAIQGRQALAEKELRAALELAPNAAHIHNNYGYALLLQGRADEAVTAFQTALRLDPEHVRAADNLKSALARLEGRQEGAPAMPSPVRAVEATPAVPLPSLETAPVARLTPVAANIYELQLPAVPRPPATVLAATQPGSMPLPARLEVSNGNGVGGLARKTSDYLKGMGYGVQRLTNQKPFDQGVTEIQYRPGFEQQAMTVRKALANRGAMATSTGLRQDIQVRVVLGKDIRALPKLAAAEDDRLQLAAAGQDRP